MPALFQLRIGEPSADSESLPVRRSQAGEDADASRLSFTLLTAGWQQGPDTLALHGKESRGMTQATIPFDARASTRRSVARPVA